MRYYLLYDGKIKQACAGCSEQLLLRRLTEVVGPYKDGTLTMLRKGVTITDARVAVRHKEEHDGA